jgi:hypothetical protein
MQLIRPQAPLILSEPQSSHRRKHDHDHDHDPALTLEVVEILGEACRLIKRGQKSAKA